MSNHRVSLLLQVFIRALGNIGILVFALYTITLAKRTFGPRRKVLSRQYRPNALSDFPSEISSLSQNEVSVHSEARIRRSLTGVGAEEPTTTCAKLKEAAMRSPNQVAFMVLNHDTNEWTPSLTWKQYFDRATILAEKLVVEHKVEFHDVALFVSESRPEFFVSWMAVQLCGGICCPAHAWSSKEEILALCELVKPTIVFLDRKDLLETLSPQVVAHVVVLDQEEKGEDIISAENAASRAALLTARTAQIRPGHASQILLSSGQQALKRKPYLLSHDNVTFSARSFLAHHENTSRWGATGEEHICSFLPLSHVGTLVCDLHVPMAITSSKSYRTHCTLWTLNKGKSSRKELLFASLKQIRPTLFLGMPAVWDRFRRKLMEQEQGVLSKMAMDVGAQWFQAVQAGKHGTQPMGLALAERYVLNAIKRTLGLDRCKLLMSSGAPIALAQLEYFGSLGLHIMESFGATACSGPQTMGRQDYFLCGKVGVSLPGYELKITSEGEICVRGRHVCMGVLNDPETTRQLFDSESFFHTHHLGRVDELGCLELLGRKHELVNNKLGLSQIEAIVRDKARPWVDRAVVVSETPNGGGAHKLRVFLTLRNASVDTSVLQECISKANQTLQGVCEIEHFLILRGVKFSSFGSEAELTHTGQARRSVVKKKYPTELRTLMGKNYSSASQQ